MKGIKVKSAIYLAAVVAILFIAISTQLSSATVSAQLKPKPGDGIFSPIISQVAIDRTGRPITVEVAQPEPSFSVLMVPGKPTGDSFVINFPNSTAGGDCTYTGKGRYIIESTGVLTFQILADCGNLRRAYGYMICRLNEDLHCSEGPWWYFKDRKFAATNQGVVINGSSMVPWRDASEAPQQLQVMAGKIKAMNDRFRGDSHVVHSRLISCREFHPSSHSYAIHELPTTCAIQRLCNGIPSVDSLRDGELIDWNSSVGAYVKQQNKISDVSNWVCWIRTQ